MSDATCAQARLLLSNLLQIMRDTAHTLEAHHNPAASAALQQWVEALTPHKDTLFDHCQHAPLLPPWEAPACACISQFMDGVHYLIDAQGAHQLAQQAVRALYGWYQQHPDLPAQPELMAQLEQLLHTLTPPETLRPAMPHHPEDDTEPVNEEGS